MRFLIVFFPMALERMIKHPLSPLTRRTLWALLAIFVVMTIGTVGVKELTAWRWIDSFYFMAMVATAQGPPNSPPGLYSKIFVAIMAFVSVGTLITATGVIFGPYLGYLFHKGISFSEKEIEKEIQRKESKKGTRKEGQEDGEQENT